MTESALKEKKIMSGWIFLDLKSVKLEAAFLFQLKLIGIFGLEMEKALIMGFEILAVLSISVLIKFPLTRCFCYRKLTISFVNSYVCFVIIVIGDLVLLIQNGETK